MSTSGRSSTDPVALLDAPPQAQLPAEPPASLKVAPEVPAPAEGPAALGICPQGHASSADAAFCGTCGAPLRQRVLLQDARPVPEAQLDEAQRAERARLHQTAVQAGRQDPGIPAIIQPAPNSRTVLIHFVEDGLTAFGTVWMRGQELEMTVGGPRWELAERWILQDDRQQMGHYGKVMFRPGPWPGARTYTAAAGHFDQLEALSKDAPPVTGPSRDELAAADRREAARGRGIPAPAMR